MQHTLQIFNGKHLENSSNSVNKAQVGNEVTSKCKDYKYFKFLWKKQLLVDLEGVTNMYYYIFARIRTSVSNQQPLGHCHSAFPTELFRPI